MTVRALAEGTQLVTLRKGGIREEHRRFALEHERFFLYPTFDHQRHDLIREPHRAAVEAALAEGVWPGGRPSAPVDGGGPPPPDRVIVRACAAVARAYETFDPEAVRRLGPFHIWTDDYALERLRWKRRHPLHVLFLRVLRLDEPVTVAVRDEYAGCRSWIGLTDRIAPAGDPVVPAAELDRAARELDRILGEPAFVAGAPAAA